MMNSHSLVLVHTLLPDRKKRLVDADCRAGKYPGVRKVGRQWMIRIADFEAWLRGQSANDTSSAEADLRRAGFR
jgi:hypothetical protein